MATSWGPDEDIEFAPRRSGYRGSTPLALLAAAAAEAAIRRSAGNDATDD